MKTLIKILTGIACIGILFVGATREFNTPALIVSTICLAWLALITFATFRKEVKHNEQR